MLAGLLLLLLLLLSEAVILVAGIFKHLVARTLLIIELRLPKKFSETPSHESLED